MKELVNSFISTCPFPAVTDVAGVVVDVGPGVKDLAPGDEVVAMLNSLVSERGSWQHLSMFVSLTLSWLLQNGGGLAEYVVAPASLTVKRPPAVSAAEGAGLPIAAGTALQSLRSIGAKFDGTGKPLNVLITAASGGVGLYAVQLAKLANLHVTATCGAGNIDLVKSLGADEVMDYKTPEGASLQSPSGKKYDGVVHCTVGVSWSKFKPLLSSRGRVIDLTPNSSAILTSGLHKVTFAKKRVVPLFLRVSKADLDSSWSACWRRASSRR
jgi:NADPH:quinone reductase-like Zn-dependent oxidoreductase